MKRLDRRRSRAPVRPEGGLPCFALCAWLIGFSSIASGQIFISQYYEGTSNNKWIELYNAGTSSVDLGADQYKLGLWSNSTRQDWKTNSAPINFITFSDTIAPGATYVIRHTSATLPTNIVADLTNNTVMGFNGDDSLVLYTGSVFSTTGILDSIGLTNTSLQDTSFVRKPTIRTGNTGIGNLNSSEWIGFSLTDVDNAITGTTARLRFHAVQVVRYVAINNPSPVSPYTSWATAATNIQNAVDVAAPDELVLVSNGVYQTGGRVVGSTLLTNRVVIDKPITVQSVNGPAVTSINGAWHSATVTNGNRAVRCVWMTNGATLAGFTLTNGATRSGGLDSPWLRGGGLWAQSASVVVSNCIFTSNSAFQDGGGTYGGTLINCRLFRNRAQFGGGAGFYENPGSLYNCIITSNSANYGGGTSDEGTLYNCTLTGNSAVDGGGGSFGSTLNNCIVYFNTSSSGGANYQGGAITYSCTTPMPAGAGNITNNPLFVNIATTNLRLQATSPCINAGANQPWMIGATDFDGNPRIVGSMVDMGAYEAAFLAGDFTANVQSGTNSLAVIFTANVSGTNLVDVVYYWDFQNDAVTDVQGTNRSVVTNVYAPGTYSVSLLVSNAIGETAGKTKLNFIFVESSPSVSTVKYVAVNNPSPVWPYISWATAATNIQDAVDVTSPGDTVLVSNGIYRTGMRNSPVVSPGPNRLVITNWITVASVNGPEFTIIDAAQTNVSGGVRGVYMTNGAQMVGFTIMNGKLNRVFDDDGGGVLASGSFLRNCIIRSNSTDEGGGVFGGTLENCLIENNAATRGGGASLSTLKNCTVIGNTASDRGGGIWLGTLYNSIVYFNSAPNGPNHYFADTFNYSCTTPMPSGGTGNITDDPRLASSFRPALDSPCRAAGSPAYTNGVDIDGETWNNPPSMGCDEPRTGSLTGALQVAIFAPNMKIIPGNVIPFTAIISGRAASNHWNFSDGTFATNLFFGLHTWINLGNYLVTLTAFNESFPGGVSAIVTVSVISVEASTVYVWTNSPTPVPPYTNWATAAHTIQDAVDSQFISGGRVLVTDGVYRAGTRKSPFTLSSNRVVITNNVMLQSVNGPAATIIEGQGPNGVTAVRCAWMSAGSLNGFTLTNGFTRLVGDGRDTIGGGGYLDGAVLSNCVIVGNGAIYGGGIHGGTLFHCMIKANSAALQGGGANESTLYNCILTDNTAGSQGGGAFECKLYNCTVVGNSSGVHDSDALNSIIYFNAGGNYSPGSGVIEYSCTTPLPVPASILIGNITNDPQFVNIPADDFRLEVTSPCLDRGLNEGWMNKAVDLGGRPRLMNSRVDMGVHEFRFEANVRAMLAGAHTAGTMRVSGNLPTNSPYAADVESVSALPSNAVDWVLIELRPSPTSPPSTSVSAILRNDGQVIRSDGGTTIYLEAAGNQYVVIKHRNHISAMSATAVFTNQIASFDFSTNALGVLGGANSLAQIETNIWALIAGDADGDGEILSVDEMIWRTQEGEE